jgi:hypothetical protein
MICQVVLCYDKEGEVQILHRLLFRFKSTNNVLLLLSKRNKNFCYRNRIVKAIKLINNSDVNSTYII